VSSFSSSCHTYRSHQFNLTIDHRHSGPTKHLSEELTISSRPDLSSAPRVVSGGRALKSAEQFNGVMEPLADSLSAGEFGCFMDGSLRKDWGMRC
jgi:electron transfer flavoprotein alpha subunit